jgi:RHS repeat-associated protein
LKAIPGIVASVTYDASGRPLVQTNVNGTVTTRSYSAQRGFLTRIGTTAGAATIQSLAYAVDPTGMLEGVTSPFPDESWSYDYDDLYRLTQATNTGNPAESQSWQYDAIGRITYNSRIGAYTYPGAGLPRPHAPLTAGVNSYSYDLNGNLLTGGGRTLVWNPDNLPTQVTAGQTTVDFTYGGLGDRLKKTSGSGTSLYPMGDDYEVTGGVVTKYVSAQGLGVVAKRTGGATFWLHADRLGSVQAVTDAAGQLVQRRTYRPYGETIADSTSHVESRGWIEQRNDAETGLTYLHARYYDPALGLFLSPDPIAAALNTYGYASGDPLNASDRSGLLEYRDDTETRFHDEGPRAGLGVFVGNPFATPVGVGRMDELLQRDLNNFETASTTTWTYADGSSKTEDYYGGAVTTTERNSAGDVTSSTTTTTTTETWGGCSGSSSVQCSTNMTVANETVAGSGGSAGVQTAGVMIFGRPYFVPRPPPPIRGAPFRQLPKTTPPRIPAYPPKTPAEPPPTIEPTPEQIIPKIPWYLKPFFPAEPWLPNDPFPPGGIVPPIDYCLVNACEA